MRLATLNRWLRRVGVVLVVAVPDDASGWVELRLEPACRHPLVPR